MGKKRYGIERQSEKETERGKRAMPVGGQFGFAGLARN